MNSSWPLSISAENDDGRRGRSPPSATLPRATPREPSSVRARITPLRWTACYLTCPPADASVLLACLHVSPPVAEIGWRAAPDAPRYLCVLSGPARKDSCLLCLQGTVAIPRQPGSARRQTLIRRDCPKRPRKTPTVMTNGRVPGELCGAASPRRGEKRPMRSRKKSRASKPRFPRAFQGPLWLRIRRSVRQNLSPRQLVGLPTRRR